MAGEPVTTVCFPGELSIRWVRIGLSQWRLWGVEGKILLNGEKIVSLHPLSAAVAGGR